METLTQPLNKEAGDRIARLDGRQGARGSCGLTGRRTEAIVLGCRRGEALAHARIAQFVDRKVRDAGQRMSASWRSMPRVEPARSRACPTGSLGAVMASSQPTQQTHTDLHLPVFFEFAGFGGPIPSE